MFLGRSIVNGQVVIQHKNLAIVCRKSWNYLDSKCRRNSLFRLTTGKYFTFEKYPTNKNSFNFEVEAAFVK